MHITAPNAPSLYMPQNDAVSFMQQGSFYGRRASIYLFTPKNLSEQYRRAHAYKFSPRFLGDLQNTIQDSAVRGINTNLSSFMVGSAEANFAVMPVAQGAPIATKHLTEMWTFILIVDNDTDPTSMIHAAINSRTICSGYIVDEPVGVGYGGQQLPINQMACFIITHRTTVNRHDQMGSMGSVSNIHVVANADIIPAQGILASSFTNELYSLAPGNVNRSVVSDPFGKVEVRVGSHNLLQSTAGNGNPTIGAEYASPKHHMHFISNNVQRAIINSNPLASNEEDVLSIMGSGESLKVAAFDAYMSQTANADLQNMLPSDVPFSFADLLRRYPDLDIVDCRMPFNNPWSDQTVSQAAPTAQNVGHAILASTVPYMLADHGLADVSFRYNSYMSDGISPIRGIYKLESVSSIVPMHDDIKYIRFKNFMEKMKMLVFPILQQLNGEFDVMMNCSLAGPGVIQLHFLDNQQQLGGFYETNNILGGFNTPLVGMRDVFENNVTELSNLKNAILEVQPPYNNQLSQWG